jgi:hypothetical protein
VLEEAAWSAVGRRRVGRKGSKKGKIAAAGTIVQWKPTDVGQLFRFYVAIEVGRQNGEL